MEESIKINGKTVTRGAIEQVLPLKIGDWYTLSSEHDIEPEQLAGGGMPFHKLVQFVGFVLRRAVPELTHEDVMTMTDEDFRWVSSVINERSGRLDRPT